MPSLVVSWTGTRYASEVTYTVAYSTSSGNKSSPPSEAFTKTGITCTSTALEDLQPNTTYYIWIRYRTATNQERYNSRRSAVTYGGM